MFDDRLASFASLAESARSPLDPVSTGPGGLWPMGMGRSPARQERQQPRVRCPPVKGWRRPTMAWMRGRRRWRIGASQPRSRAGSTAAADSRRIRFHLTLCTQGSTMLGFHLFFECPFSLACWNSINVHWDFTL